MRKLALLLIVLVLVAGCSKETATPTPSSVLSSVAHMDRKTATTSESCCGWYSHNSSW